MTSCNPPPAFKPTITADGLDLESKVLTEDSSSFWRPVLTSEQKRWCGEAIDVLKKKKANVDAEFHSLTINRPPKYVLLSRLKTATLSSNKDKNRYSDVLPFDDTRVILQPTKGSGSDYINANFIEGPGNRLPRFIATQGPLRSTVVDFWEMVMQQRCLVIVMLTNLSDGNMEKCAPYFPTGADQAQVYGRLRVTNKHLSSSRFSIVKRLLEVRPVEKRYEYPLNVLHLEYLHWPDHEVPPWSRQIREIFRCLSSVSHDIPHDTFVVHCSAGIGRCGTYITVDHTLRRILLGDPSALDIEATVKSFRDQRNGMVQTKEQYSFCYTAIIDELEELLGHSKTAEKQQPEAV